MNLVHSELFALILVGTILSIGIALSARIKFTNVPWGILIFKLRYLRELGMVSSYFPNLLVWVLVSLIFIVSIAETIKGIEPTIPRFYKIINYSNSDGKAGLLTLIIFSIGFYWYLSLRALQFNKKNDYEPPKEIHKIFRVIFSPIRIFHYYIPKLISENLLKWFYDTGKIPINLCTEYLVGRFKEDTCIACLERHKILHRGSPNTQELEKQEEIMGIKDFDLRNKARALISLKIRIVGFSATENAMIEFIRFNSRTNDFEERRNNPIHRVCSSSSLKKVTLITEQGNIEAASLIDYSENGNGGYLKTDKNFAINEKIVIAIADTKIKCEVKHGMPKSINSKDKEVVFGIGVCIASENTRDFLEIINKIALVGVVTS